MTIRQLHRMSAISFITIMLATSTDAFEGPYTQHSSEIDGKTFGALVTDPFFANSPEWKAGNPLPVTEENVVKAAHAEVAKLVPDPDRWRFEGFDILRFRGSQKKSLWYFLAHFSATVSRKDDPQNWRFATISIPVNFRGIALPLAEVR